MRNVAPSRALVRRSRRLLEIAFVVVAIGIFLAIVGLALYAVPLTASTSSTFGLYNLGRTVLFIGGVFLGVVGVILAIRAFTWRTENDLALITGQYLEQYLDDQYTFIRNISKRSVGYIDAVLVGPPGVLIFRIVDYEGAFLNEAGRWLKADTKGEWRPMVTNPTKETVEDINSLREFLARNDLRDIPIFGVVVFLKDDPAVQLALKDPVVPATHLSSLHTRLQNNYLAKERIDEPVAIAIVQLLYDE